MIRSPAILESFHLTPDQLAAAAERDRDVIVTAGAGCGKTRTLVARYISLLADGLSPRRVAAITFTEKAAREMRSRVRSSLALQIASSRTAEELHRWSEIEAQIDSARIGTIHSLCAEILRTHPAEAGIDPRFEVLDEGVAATLRAGAVENTIISIVENADFSRLLEGLGSKALVRLLAYLLDHRLEAQSAFTNAPDPRPVLLNALEKLACHPSLAEPLERIRSLQDSGHLAEDAGTKLTDQIGEMLLAWEQAELAIARMDYAMAASCLFAARRKMGGSTGSKSSQAKSWLADMKNAYNERLNPWLGGDKASDPPPDPEVEKVYIAVLPLVEQAFRLMLENYQAALRQRQALDFDDLENGAANLLSQPALKSYWQGEIEAVLVDEFQDTNERQRKIVRALSGEKPGRLFVVGDARQSIYRFRRADVKVFRSLMDEIRDQGGLVITLDQTYRAHAPLLNATGDLLSVVMGTRDDPERPYYVPFSPLHSNHDAAREGIQPPYVEFVVGCGEDTASARPAAAHALARRLHELMNTKQIKRWDDVTLLFRASTGFPAYEEAFEEAGIPFVTVAGQGFYNRPEIRDVVNMLRALADPWDDLAIAGLLRSPAFGLNDAALYFLRCKPDKKLPYWSALQGDLASLDELSQANARRAREILNELQPLVDRLPVAELLKRLVDRVDYRAILASADVDSSHRGAGARLWRNLDKLIADAQASGLVSVRDFLEYLNTLRDVGAREGEAPAEAEGAVRLMTIHKAKGLEFPVVVLADAARLRRNSPGAAFLAKESGLAFRFEQAHSQPLIYRLMSLVDAEESKAEENRLLYVALTRAQEKLLISGHITSTDRSTDAWLSKLVNAGHVDLAEASDSSQPFEVQTDCGHPLRVWVMSSDAMDLLPVQPDSAPEWPDSTEEPLYCSLLNPEPEIEDPEPDEILHPWRATGSRQHPPAEAIGRMVHMAIQRWLFPGDPNLTKLLETAAYGAGLADSLQRSEALRLAEGLLLRLRNHPLWQEIDRAGERYHEVPYSYLGANRRIDTGFLDLLYCSDDGWQIIDFKTDAVHSAAQRQAAVEKHRHQMHRYATAGQNLLHQPVMVRLCFLDDEGSVSLVEV